MKLYKLILFLAPLTIGGFIYVIFRSEKLLMFEWFQTLHLQKPIQLLRNLFNSYNVPNWFKYNFPDGLWIFSYVLISLHIWKKTISKQTVFWIFSIPIVAILSEIFQFLKIIPGTFDKVDIWFYVLGTFLPIYLYRNLLTSNIIINYERY